ncbi:NUDIX hydrolase [Peptococcus simiae]|uniref:NUDIX hydrolase n=1 Tax=Peptococcus simiae TaxID=1643805 RepID=A0ABW9GXS5_9FIRM
MGLTTLCYLKYEDDVLMLYRNKKDHDVNRGKWIGVGGKFLPGESPDECARREIREETGLVPETLAYRGIVTFCYDEAPPEYMHVYLGTVDSRDLTPCDEGTLRWVPEEEVPALALWPGDRLFLPLALDEEGPAFSMKLVYKDDILVQAALNGEPMKVSVVQSLFQ